MFQRCKPYKVTMHLAKTKSKLEVNNYKCNKQQVRVSNRKRYESHKLNEWRQQQTQTNNE